uniref:Uncharacterized protein n=1 Tax=Schistosoma haematobium TaxID=6185 RepID=A0A094ZRR1_SCHHA
MNSIFMVITFIILIIGVGLLNLHTKGYEIIISVTVDTALASLAILLGVKLRVRERKLELILFSVWCVFGGIGIIFMRALRNHYVLDTSWISWWCAILIVIVYTAYYLCRSGKEEQSRVMFIIFL